MLVYRDLYRSNKIYEYEKLYLDFFIRKYSKEEMKELKIRIERDYHEIQRKYGYIFEEIQEKMLEVYRVCFQEDKREKEIERCVKGMIDEGVKIYERRYIKPIVKKVRFEF